MKKVIAILTGTLFLCATLIGCRLSTAPKPEESNALHRYEASFLDVFDTVTKLVLYAEDEAAAAAIVEKVHTELQQYHRLFDIYNDYEGLNNIKTVNDNAAAAPVTVDMRLIDLIDCAKQMYRLTNGKMNIAFGSVLSLWHEYREAGIDDAENAKLPDMDALTAANLHVSIDSVVVDGENATVYFADPDLRLDVGAIAKGYAAQKVCEYSRNAGVTSMLLSVGGNVCGIGRRADGNDWKVTIQDPDMQSSDYLCLVAVNDRCLVTSGSYQRYYTVDGKTYHHIIDPVTLMPAAYFVSVSILCRDSALADALSTAVFNMPLADGLALVESLDDVECMWLDAAGTETFSSGFSQYVIEK